MLRLFLDHVILIHFFPFQKVTSTICSFPHCNTEISFMFTGDGSLVFFNESAGLSYISVSLLLSSLDRDLTFSVQVPGSGTASEGMI